VGSGTAAGAKAAHATQLLICVSGGKCLSAGPRKARRMFQLLHGFDDLNLSLQQPIDHLAQRNALVRCPLRQIALYIGVQLDGQAHLRIRPEEFASLAF
jgi:hypothetical protein